MIEYVICLCYLPFKYVSCMFSDLFEQHFYLRRLCRYINMFIPRLFLQYYYHHQAVVDAEDHAKRRRR